MPVRCLPLTRINTSLTRHAVSQWFQYAASPSRRSRRAFADFLLPHSYIPIKSDYSDLTDAAAFFIGAPDGTGAHDALAKKIALNGKKWAAEHWREADMYV
jgi:hypothetical protein